MNIIRNLVVVVLVGVCAAVLLCNDVEAGESRAVIVAGDPGIEENSAERFDDWRKRWVSVLKNDYGFKAANIKVLRSPARDVVTTVASEEGDQKKIKTYPADMKTVPASELASFVNVRSAFRNLVQNTGKSDQAVIVMIGHGYGTPGGSKFCLPGKDLSDVDAARTLSKLRGKQIVILNLSPSSVTWAKLMKGRSRVVITAALSADMGSQSYFCEFFLRAIKGGDVTVMDAFNKAEQTCIKWYQNQFFQKKGKGVTANGMKVHGSEFQEIWKKFYPNLEITVGDAEPREAVNDEKQDKAFIKRRVIAEIAALEDNGDGIPSCIYEDGKTITLLPSDSGDGNFAKTIVFGKP